MLSSILCFTIVYANTVGKDTVNGHTAGPCEIACLNSPSFPFDTAATTACMSKCNSAPEGTPDSSISDTVYPEALTPMNTTQHGLPPQGTELPNYINQQSSGSQGQTVNGQDIVNGKPATPCQKACMDSPSFPFDNKATNACMAKCS